MKKFSACASAMLAVTALSGACGAAADVPQRPPSTFALSGLERPAEVLVDRWGIPHLYAGTHYDVFVAQGFMAAHDRLWQMDMWCKRGLGEMAKDFGAGWVESDRAARAVIYRGDMYREWLAYGSDAKRVAEAFTTGVNAYVAQMRAKPELLPVEFRLLGYQPAVWSPDDVVRIRHHGLALNFTSEIDRALLATVPCWWSSPKCGAPMRCAPPGSNRAWHRTLVPWTTCARGTGTSSARR